MTVIFWRETKSISDYFVTMRKFTMRKYGSNNYCFMAQDNIIFNSIYHHCHESTCGMKDMWWVYDCPKIDLCHYTSEETTLSLCVVNNYAGGSESHIHLMVGCSDVTPICDLEVHRTKCTEHQSSTVNTSRT